MHVQVMSRTNLQLSRLLLTSSSSSSSSSAHSAYKRKYSISIHQPLQLRSKTSVWFGRQNRLLVDRPFVARRAYTNGIGIAAATTATTVASFWIGKTYWQHPAYCDAGGLMIGVSQQQDDVSALIIATEDKSSWIAEMERKIKRAWRVFIRLIKLSFTLAPVIAFYPFLLLLHQRDPEQDARDIVLSEQAYAEPTGLQGRYLKMCLRCTEWSGAAVIKLMQWAGSRPDLFGHEFCSVFRQLQDTTTPHAWKHTEKALRDAFGPDWRDHIELGEILGSGCIGQVYRGNVWDENNKKQKVAVKVLHPNVEEDIDADLDIMRLSVRFLQALPFDVFASLKWLDLVGVVEEFADLLKLQLDLRHEAENLVKFNKNFRDEKSVQFPQLVPGFEPTKDVLVESFCEGIPVMQFARENKNDKKKLRDLCFTGIYAVCKMLFLDNFMHGDLHPGNVFISTDGKRVILLDVGIVAEYSESDHEAIVDILAAFIRHDGRKAGRLMIDDSNRRLKAKNVDDVALSEEKFIDKIDAIALAATASDYLMEHLGTYITYICDAAAQHHVLLNSSFISACLAVKVQEGIALALDPSLEIWEVATPVIFESERRRGILPMSRLFGLENFVKAIFGGNKSTQEPKKAD